MIIRKFLEHDYIENNKWLTKIWFIKRILDKIWQNLLWRSHWTNVYFHCFFIQQLKVTLDKLFWIPNGYWSDVEITSVEHKCPPSDTFITVLEKKVQYWVRRLISVFLRIYKTLVDVGWKYRFIIYTVTSIFRSAEEKKLN